MTYRFNF